MKKILSCFILFLAIGLGGCQEKKEDTSKEPVKIDTESFDIEFLCACVSSGQNEEPISEECLEKGREFETVINALDASSRSKLKAELSSCIEEKAN